MPAFGQKLQGHGHCWVTPVTFLAHSVTWPVTPHRASAMQGTMPGHIPWWFPLLFPPVPLCHLCCPHFQMSRSNEPVIAFCHPVSTRAQLPPGSDVQGHRGLNPTHASHGLPTSCPRASEVVCCWGFCLGYPRGAYTSQTTSPDVIAVCLCPNTASEHRLRASTWVGTGGYVVKIRQAVDFLHYPGSYTVACSVQMLKQISKVITRAITVAKNTAVT